MAIVEFVIEDISANISSDISQLMTSCNASWTMDAVSQVTAKFQDSELKLFRNNYFQVRRLVRFNNEPFEIAAVEITQGQGSGAEITLECRRREIQAMKRNKTPEAFQGITATDYASLVAKAYGLNFVGEPTSVKRSINQSTNPDSDESVLDVLRRLAGEAQFSMFESDGTLYFASQEWLLGKWANLTFTYPFDANSPYQVLTIPTCRRSDDSPLDAEGQILLRRTTTTMSLRAGMTITLSGMGEFDQQYLISEVAYAYGKPEPIGVSCRTPVKKKSKK